MRDYKHIRNKQITALSRFVAVIFALVFLSQAEVQTFAAFTDEGRIRHYEAVSKLVSLGIVGGRDDGSFDPQGTLTRAEMCKMIAIIMNGGAAIDFDEETATFDDTVGHWAEHYIAICYDFKIVHGQGNGKFDPNGRLTGAATAKMALAALGYNAETEGMTGTQWLDKTVALARKVGLCNGIESLDLSDAISRDDAVQLLYNALNANEIIYDQRSGGVEDLGVQLIERFSDNYDE